MRQGGSQFDYKVTLVLATLWCRSSFTCLRQQLAFQHRTNPTSGLQEHSAVFCCSIR